ncbi:hypothetical protein DASC09_031340 [Saccharomycopsis crataegensis]|uniref:Zn(2)-C6 fungal-type domain-containing protein n=1 Tax=Saccharomycopsis crataegensis TaxID=43959 RepID=A0AAV5QME8_9ASCO|nr:hypothetical protein DASC09_031340 [Saccharomycopsis crataegensis]
MLPSDAYLKKEKKRRTKRACDFCNLKRSRCDGENPCSHCVLINKPCTYLRAEKKRGRASEKYPKNPKRRKDCRQKDVDEYDEYKPDEIITASPVLESNVTEIEKTLVPTNVHNMSTSQSENLDGLHYHSLTKKNLISADYKWPNETISSPSNSSREKTVLIEPHSPFSTPEEHGKGLIYQHQYRPYNSPELISSEYALNFNHYIFSIDANAFKSPTFLKTQHNYSLIDNINLDSITHSAFNGVRYVLLLKVLPYLQQVNLPGNVASDVLEYYFDNYVSPSCKISSILRKKTFLTLVNPVLSAEEQPHVRNTGEALILTILTTAVFDISHFFMTGHKRKMLFGKLIQIIKGLIQISSTDEDEIIDGTFDDIVTCCHLVCISPLLGNPAISHLWLRRGVRLAKKLRINEEDLSDVSEEVREERRRCWWTLYILDKHLNIALSTSTVITDQESKDLFHPCDDSIYNDITIVNLPSPFENDIDRVKGIQFNRVGPGVFGWLLMESMIIGSLVYYKMYIMNQRKISSSSTSPITSDSMGSNDDCSIDFRNQLKVHLDMLESSLPSLLQYSKVDSSYASLVTCVLNSLLNKDVFYWEPNGALNDNGTNFEEDLEWCIKYSEAFQDLITSDPDMRRYPFVIRLYIFFACVDVINLLNNLDKGFLKYKNSNIGALDSKAVKMKADALAVLCNRIKSMAHIIVRCVESCMSTLPADYLRVIRNIIMDALRDMDCLLLVKGFEKQFDINREKRKKIISVYSYVVNGAGIGL